MVQSQSALFLPTLREDPADAEAISHRLSLRAGLIRQVGAGLYSFLPAGWRVHQRVAQVIREEMDAIGGQEMYMPLITPAEFWQSSGRYGIPEVYRLSDRFDRPFVLAMTHEETVAFHFREIGSYRELPKILYHFAPKGRDEPRPRAGLLRVREFIMKDSYSFDVDEEGLDTSYWNHAHAYRRIFERLGLDVLECAGDVGIMGGSMAHEYLAPCEAGENEIAVCERGDYHANVEAAVALPRAPTFPDALASPAEIETPGVTTIDALASSLGIDAAATSKAMPVVRTSDGSLVLGLVRGDHRLHELKLARALGSEFRPAHPEEIRAAFGADGGSLGPVGVAMEIVADQSLREGQFVAGANRNGWHLRGVEAGRDYAPRFADIRVAEEGDACVSCGGRIAVSPAIEVGNIFKLGTRFSEAMGATVLDDGGNERLVVMGSYGIGPARTMAAVIEQCNDDRGIVWPRQIAPYDVHVLALAGGDGEVLELASSLAESLGGVGWAVLTDDRDQRPGEKFADADLIGCPIRITVGRKSLDDGCVDVRRRSEATDERVPHDSVLTWMEEH
ncbi:MAG: proline--tRNA ligase [Actinobacteria bacterium]|nr:proline--tRNA ligase [Actinomycetota bacterium]